MIQTGSNDCSHQKKKWMDAKLLLSLCLQGSFNVRVCVDRCNSCVHVGVSPTFQASLAHLTAWGCALPPSFTLHRVSAGSPDHPSTGPGLNMYGLNKRLTKTRKHSRVRQSDRNSGCWILVSQENHHTETSQRLDPNLSVTFTAITTSEPSVSSLFCTTIEMTTLSIWFITS